MLWMCDLKFDVASCYEENYEVVDFCVCSVPELFKTAKPLYFYLCKKKKNNVVFLCFKYYDQKLSYLVPPSSPTPRWVDSESSGGRWTQSSTNNFLINFLFLCVI